MKLKFKGSEIEILYAMAYGDKLRFEEGKAILRRTIEFAFKKEKLKEEEIVAEKMNSILTKT